MLKKCNHCLDNKNIEDFGNDKRNKDGKQGRCYDCCNSIRKLKYSNDINYREKQKLRQKKYKKYANENAKKHIRLLSDFYIVKELKRGTSLTSNDLIMHRELIEAKRQIIKNKRLCRK